MGTGVYTKSGQFVVVCDTPNTWVVTASTTAQELAPANNDRVQGQIFNESTAVLYIRWGTTASSALYTAQIQPRGFYELPRVNPYVGPIWGVWAAANGRAMVTEAT